jgi:hypothetical protein
MKNTVLYTVSKKETGWEDRINHALWGAEAALELQPNPTGNDPQRVILVDYKECAHVIHQRGKWSTFMGIAEHPPVFPEEPVEVYDEVVVTLRVHLLNGATEDGCRDVANDVLNGKMNDQIDNIELVEFEPNHRQVKQ